MINKLQIGHWLLLCWINYIALGLHDAMKNNSTFFAGKLSFCYICHTNIIAMTVLGHIIGIAIVIFGIILLVRLIYYALTFDFDAHIFKTEIKIKITDKKIK